MKLFKKWYEVLGSLKLVKLKKKMGVSITLSDIENIPYVKKITKRG